MANWAKLLKIIYTAKIMNDSKRQIGSRIVLILGRSFIPITALLIIFGTILWGPWISLLLAAGWWFMAGRLV